MEARGLQETAQIPESCRPGLLTGRFLKHALIFAASIVAVKLLAQSNEPVRLALISATDETSAVSDVLTARLSTDQKVHLLERNEIERVYREQGMSAANRNDLKLGRILGADGLLLLDIVKTPQATNLAMRLIAVKPGVVLTDGSFPWPLKDTSAWAESAAIYLNSFLPKLSVLIKDAVPLSVVNLRSAAQSADAQETERQLKLLAIQRLSQERQFFVLERQRMQLLSEEKELKADESAFWNGSYLLEGVVDQNGYSKDVMTINARLTPPKGGAPLLFEVSGSRANYSEVINRLAAKVIELLKINSTVKEWNAADESAQFLEEAKWALRWGVYVEAQAAAESAWALGKRDLDCALMRVNSYVSEIPQMAAPNVRHYRGGKKDTRYANINEPPDPRRCDLALYALKCYYEFSRSSPEGEPKVLWRGPGFSDWHNSSWYQSGIDALVAASGVLQHYNFVPESQKPVADKLAELRALARAVAELISRSSSVHDSYFVGDRVATYDELGHTIHESPNVFRCKADWGCYWQERPEDSIALYRELMTSPVFSYIHDGLWLRGSERPRLVAWNGGDKTRISTIWSDFIEELNSSTNALLQLEAKAIQLADAADESSLAASFTNLFNGILDNHDVLVANNVDVLYLGWNTDHLVEAKTSGGVVSDLKESLQRLFYSQYRPKLEAMEQEYRNKTVPARKLLSDFKNQERYLKENRTYDFSEFVSLFQFRNYSQAQAREIQPLVDAYKANLATKSQSATGIEKAKLVNAVAQVGFLANDVDRVLNPPPLQAQAPMSNPVPVAKSVVLASATTNTPEIVTNPILIKKFLKIPLDGLEGDEVTNVTLTAHHWLEGKLLLDFQYQPVFEVFDGKRVFKQTAFATRAAIATLDPETEHWEVIGCPEMDSSHHNYFYDRSTLLRGNLYNCDGGQIRQYDFATRQWKVLDVSGGDNFQLFAVAGHLYAANGNTIFEIINEGKATRILASTRRNPALSALDKLDNLGAPTLFGTANHLLQALGAPMLFEGPNHSLRACVRKKIYAWTQENWQEVGDAPSSLEVFDDGVLLRQTPEIIPRASLSRLTNGASAPELCLLQVWPSPYITGYPGMPRRQDTNSAPIPKPIWKIPTEFPLGTAAAALRQSDLYLLVDHSEVRNIADDQHVIVKQAVVGKNGYDAELLCFSHDLETPQKLFLKFDAPDGNPPLAGVDPRASQLSSARPPAWILFTGKLLFFGVEGPRLGCQAGVWTIPISELEPAIAIEKQNQLAALAREKALAIAVEEARRKNVEQRRADLMAKYDRNHNGAIDPEEKEAALDDPAFIESELEVIDANHNGRLDAAELAWFDANQNKTLEPKELAGIDIAQHLLAAKLLKQFDANGDGLLDRAEFDNFSVSGGESRLPFVRGSFFPDENHDGYVDLPELENVLKQQTRQGLRLRGMPMERPLYQIKTNADGSINQRQLFKTAVESYWQHPGGNTNAPPFKGDSASPDASRQRNR